MNEIKSGGPAFPSKDIRIVYPSDLSPEFLALVHEIKVEHIGMSLRDYFAGQALNGICANSQPFDAYSAIAKLSYEIADAMLKEREIK